MQGGFTGLVFAIHHIHSILKGDVLVVEFAKAVNMQTQYLHGFSSFHPKQCIDPVVQRLFLHRAHVVFLKCLDIEPDHIAGMFSKQG